jgi:hypothetical protein
VFPATRRIAAPKDRPMTVPAADGFGLSIGRTGANFKYFCSHATDTVLRDHHRLAFIHFYDRRRKSIREPSGSPEI